MVSVEQAAATVPGPQPSDPVGVSRGRARVVAAGRLVVGALMITAVLGQFGVSLRYWHRIGVHDTGLQAAHFFSAFTHQGNLAGGAILILGAVLLLRGRGPGPTWYTALRLAVLPSILIAGIVYNLLLRAEPVPPGSQLDWANEMMHVVAPIAVVLDWVLAPRPRRVRFRLAAVVLVFPILWLLYTFVRGPLVPDEITRTPYFYPYGFLDPHIAGWAPVIQLVAELMAFALVLGLLALLVWRLEDRIGRPRAGSGGSGRHRTPAAPEAARAGNQAGSSPAARKARS